MRAFQIACVMMLVLASAASGQTAGDPGEGLRIDLTSTPNVRSIKWWGKTGRTYFVQSNPTLNPNTWSYMPVVETGSDAVHSWNLSATGPRMFVRLVYTDQLYSGSAGAADFDGDGLSNAVEVASSGPRSNPMAADTDDDGFSDSVEWGAGYSPTSGQSAPSGAVWLEEQVGESWDQATWYKESTPTVRYTWLRDTETAQWPDYLSDWSTNVPPPMPMPPVVRQPEDVAFSAWGDENFDGTIASAFNVQRDVAPAGASTGTYNGGRHLKVRYGRMRLRTNYPSVQTRSRVVRLDIERWNAQLGLNGGWSGSRTNDDPPQYIQLFLPAGSVQGAPELVQLTPELGAAKFASAQIISVPKVVIKEVRFAGSSYHTLKSDDGNTTYGAPQWVDLNGDGMATTSALTKEKNYPVAFTRNTKPQVGAKFLISGQASGESVSIRASSAQGLQIPETAVTPAADDTATLPITPALNNLMNAVQFHNAGDTTAFTIDWEMRFGNGPWMLVGSTKHTFYVTLAAPESTAQGLMRETLFYIGCKNAQGRNDPAAAVDAIYGEFTDQAVYKVKPSTGEPASSKMKYWGTTGLTAAGTHELMLAENGTCQSWARFFTDVLRAQGITGVTVQEIKPGLQKSRAEMEDQHLIDFPSLPRPTIQTVTPGIAVKNCTGGAPGSRTDGWFNPIVTPDGIPGQGMQTPSSKVFNAHAVVVYGGKLYDPSYGSLVIAPGAKPIVQAWEENSVQYYVISMPDASETMSKWWVSPDDPNAQDCGMTNSYY